MDKATLAAARRDLDRCAAEMTRTERAIQDATPAADLEALRRDFDAAVDAFDEAKIELRRIEGNVRDAERRQEALRANPHIREAVAPLRVNTHNEPTVYSERAEHSFFADAFAWKRDADPMARERLERHGNENLALMRERGVQLRDVGTSAFAGLTVPQYLIDQFVPLARAGAPTLATVRKLPIPDRGMTVNLSQITTGSAVAAQSSETAAVQETDMDDTLLTINVRTYAGQQDVSRAALERSELVDAVVFGDLTADYFTKVDSAILNTDGTAGTHLGIRSTSSIITVSYTDASPTVPELYPKVADAIQQIANNRYAPALAIFMNPRRWAWLTAALDSSNRPLVVPNAQGPFNALAVGDAPEYGAVVGTFQGLPVITDANIPTNIGGGTEDLIIVGRPVDAFFWQEGDGAPRQLRFEETAGAPQLIRLAVWSYSAFTAGRYPKAWATISGTGLAAPTF